MEADETDQLKNFGYKSNKTGFSVSADFEYRDDLFLGREHHLTMKKLKQTLLLQLDKKNKKVITGILF